MYFTIIKPKMTCICKDFFVFGTLAIRVTGDVIIISFISIYRP